MEYTDGNKSGSKKIVICYVLLLFFPVLQIVKNAFDKTPMDYSITNFVKHSGLYSGLNAFAYLLPILIPAIIGWYVGKSTSKRGNHNGTILKNISISIGSVYVISMFIRAFNQ